MFGFSTLRRWLRNPLARGQQTADSEEAGQEEQTDDQPGDASINVETITIGGKEGGPDTPPPRIEQSKPTDESNTEQ